MNTDPTKVTAAILSKDGKLLIAKRNSSDILANKWEFPGGKIENGETAEACLQRELMEEFEIQVALLEERVGFGGGQIRGGFRRFIGGLVSGHFGFGSRARGRGQGQRRRQGEREI